MKNLITLLLLLAAINVPGQMVKVKNDPTHDDKPIHFGFSLGVNFMDYQISQSVKLVDDDSYLNNYYAGVNEIKPGINIHAISNLRLGEFFDLRCLPGISFGERQIYFYDNFDSLLYGKKTYQMESSYLELPFSIKYKAKREYNFRPYLMGGANLRYDLAVKREYDYKEQLIMVNPFDIYAEFGGGFDFYLPDFKFSIELKYGAGMTNIFRSTNPAGESFIDYPEYTDIIDRMKSNIFIISFHFE
ncbi:MAG: PorT family protein [Bacteroidales bacterium]|nr:PorT family protein [Bacteroidales bacterium]